VENDEQWISFRAAMGDPQWASDPRFDTNDGRAAHYKEIDAAIAEWTRTKDDYEVMHLLQAHGIAAAPVLEASRMFDDPHLRERNFFRTQRIENGKEYEFVGPIWNFEDAPVAFRQAPVGLGEHNEYVYREVLGVDDAEYEHLRDLGWITMDYDSSVP